LKMQVGDLIREKALLEDDYGVVVQIGDLRTKEPYKVYCPYWKGVVDFGAEYIHEECEVVASASRGHKK